MQDWLKEEIERDKQIHLEKKRIEQEALENRKVIVWKNTRYKSKRKVPRIKKGKNKKVKPILKRRLDKTIKILCTPVEEKLKCLRKLYARKKNVELKTKRLLREFMMELIINWDTYAGKIKYSQKIMRRVPIRVRKRINEKFLLKKNNDTV